MTNWEISPFITIFKRDQDSLNFVVELCTLFWFDIPLFESDTFSIGHAVTRGTSAQADIFPVIYAVQPRIRLRAQSCALFKVQVQTVPSILSYLLTFFQQNRSYVDGIWLVINDRSQEDMAPFTCNASLYKYCEVRLWDKTQCNWKKLGSCWFISRHVTKPK